MKKIISTALLILPCLLATPTLLAQRGDRAGHEMKPPPAHWKIPAAPALTAARAPATFAVEDGFRVELVAAEPMIHDPVAIAFDGNSRIWVAEMRGFMPNIDGKGEHDPVGRISVLEDTDGDGKIDRNAVFLDGIVLPRTVALADADQTLVYADDFDLYEIAIEEVEGELPKAGGKPKIIDKDFSKGGNPEHKPNGMRYALDNWYYNSKSDQRYRKIDGKWVKEKTEFRGQWGIDQDDYGRLFSNTNSNFVTAESIAPGLKTRNPNHQFRVSGETKMKDQRTWPSRINPGINRGYLDGFLDKDGYLVRPTAASGLAVYRGDQFPVDYYGNIFINEPGGNLVKRAIVSENDKGEFEIKPAYEDREFFTSTDERSRIVNSYTAPDGTLYLVDLYRGILQHGAYMTSYLREQVEARALDKPVGLGRIWRVVHEENEIGPQPKLIAASNEEIAKHLGHPNGFWRDTAQRLLVQRGDAKAVEPIRKVLAKSKNPKAKIHALWTLQGLGALEVRDIAAGLASEDVHARAQAIRVAGTVRDIKLAHAVLPALLETAESSPPPLVRRELITQLGLFQVAGWQKAYETLAELLIETGGKDVLSMDLAMSGLLGGGADDFLHVALNRDGGIKDLNFMMGPLFSHIIASDEPMHAIHAWGKIRDNPDLVSLFVAAALKSRKKVIIVYLMKKAAEVESFRMPITEGFINARESIGGKYKLVPLGKELPKLIAKAGMIPPEQSLELAKMFDFSGGTKATFIRSDGDKKLFAEGQKQYERICMACHQPHGRGQGFVAPPLVDSEWVMGPEKRLVALAMDGMMGPVTVDGELYQMPDIQPMMPGLRVNPEINDEQLSAILTYVRNAWGNAAPIVKTETVKQFRENNELRAPYTEKELKDVK